jgi:hypothetical protein
MLGCPNTPHEGAERKFDAMAQASPPPQPGSLQPVEYHAVAVEVELSYNGDETSRGEHEQPVLDDEEGADQRALLLWEHYAGAPEPSAGDAAEPIDGLCDRVRFTFSLWPYMVPLCLVYFSEYTMQVRGHFVLASRYSLMDASAYGRVNGLPEPKPGARKEEIH